MTVDSDGDASSSKNERRESAREKSRTLREEHRKLERRKRLYLQGGIVVVVLAFAVVVAVVISSSIQPARPGPKNMLSDGILIGAGFVAEQTAALQPGDEPVPNTRDETSDVIAIQTYVDYFCPFCAAFEKANGEQIDTLVKSGAATIEIHPIAILDRLSEGSKYSTRAANAAACVANYSPNQFYDFNSILFANQPKENTAGLSDEKLAEYSVAAKVKDASAIEKCITSQQFKGWVTDSKNRAQTGPIPGSDVDAVASTPTVIVNGMKYPGAPSDAAAFAAFVTKAAGASFNESSTSSPTPTPVPTP